jgi:hypothetical protein
MSIVRERKTFMFKKTLESAVSTYTTDFYFGFQPDEIRMVQAVYVPDAGDVDGVYSVHWEGLAFSPLFLFDSQSLLSNLNIRINTHGSLMEGRQRFTVKDIGGSDEALLQGQLGFMFEAISY